MPRPHVPAGYFESRRWTAADARTVMVAFESSGLSLAEFARREGLHIERLRRWRRRLERGVAATGPEFVEFVAPAAQAAPVEIVLRSGRVLRVGEAIAAASLRRLVEVLEEEPSC